MHLLPHDADTPWSDTPGHGTVSTTSTGGSVGPVHEPTRRPAVGHTGRNEPLGPDYLLGGGTVSPDSQPRTWAQKLTVWLFALVVWLLLVWIGVAVIKGILWTWEALS